jgi:ribosomal protein L7/L12
MNQLTEQQRQAINAEIFGGRKIEAIKLYREATGEGLKEAKDAVEDMEKDLRQREPNKFAKSTGKSGCMSVMAVVTLLISAALVTVYILRS